MNRINPNRDRVRVDYVPALKRWRVRPYRKDGTLSATIDYTLTVGEAVDRHRVRLAAKYARLSKRKLAWARLVGAERWAGIDLPRFVAL